MYKIEVSFGSEIGCGQKLARTAYIDNVQRLVDRRLGIEREPRINLSRDTSGHNLQDLLAKLNQQAVKRGVYLLVDVALLLLSILDGRVYQLGVLCLLRRSEDERGVRRGILRLVLGNCYSGPSYQLMTFPGDRREKEGLGE
jgi:hypothetical protein